MTRFLFAVGLVVGGAMTPDTPAVAPSFRVSSAQVLGHATGIWSLTASGTLRRWVVIHNITSATDETVFHVEVIGREAGAPVWSVRRLVPHMAVTMAALQASVRKPLDRGSVYPEYFDQGLARWERERTAGRARVCTTTIDACMTSGGELLPQP